MYQRNPNTHYRWEANVKLTVNVIEKLLEMIRNRNGYLHWICNSAGAFGQARCYQKLMADIVCVNHKDKPVAVAIGQKRYVQAIVENDIVLESGLLAPVHFSLAMAMAVTALNKQLAVSF